MDLLILKYLKGNLNLEEQHELSKWLAEDAKNEKVLKKLEIYWKEYNSDLEAEDLEVRRKILSRMDKEEILPSERKSSNKYLKYLIRAAAILVIGVSIGFLINESKEQADTRPAVSWIEKVSNPGQKITTILPDGTQVKLNSNSKLITPTGFSDGVRKVILEGEAFFEVTRDESRPFIIETDNMQIKVLGTSFMVSAYENDRITSVSVKSGKVEVKGNNAVDAIQLSQFESTTYNGGNNMEKSMIENPEYVFGWIDQKLLFDNQSIEEVLKQISKWYGVEIVMENRLEINKKYTASYDNPTLKEVMDILAFVYDFNYELKDNDLIIN